MTDPRRLAMYDSPEGAQEYLEEYEKTHRRWSDQRERRILGTFFQRTGPLESILDLPCGWGRHLGLLAAAGGRVVEADYSRSMLQLGRELDRQGRARDRVRASGTALPFADQAVDLVFSMRLNHHLTTREDRRRHLAEVLRVAGRWVIFSYFDAGTLKNRLRAFQVRFRGKRPKHTLSRREMEEVVAAAGFEVVAAPLLFAVGSGHRLVLARRREP